MATRWRLRRIKRRLSGLLEPGERVAAAEHLGLGGWWVLSDRALYMLGHRGEPTCLLLGEVRSVRVTPGQTTSQVTVISTAGDAFVGDLRVPSELVGRLRDLPSPPGA